MSILKILILTFILSQIASNAIGQAIDIKSIQTSFASKTEGLPSDIGNYFNDKVSNQINHFNALSFDEYANLMVQVQNDGQNQPVK